MSDRPDWLFEPAVTDQPEPWVHGPAPWRVASQVYVAFFGGVIAIAAIAATNARRLGLPRTTEQAIWGIGAGGLVLVCVIAVVMDPEIGTGTNETTYIRWISRGVALLMYFVYARMQRTADRVFALRSGEYASLVWPGILAAVGGGLLQGLTIAAVLAAL